MKTIFCYLSLLVAISQVSLAGTAESMFSDTTRAYAVPTLVKTPKNTVALSWTEKDQAGTVHFYWAESRDQGKTFGDKKLIFASQGLGNSRLMRPKLMFRPDGSAVAVFALPGPMVPVAQASASSHDAHASHSGGHQQHADHQPKSESRGGRPTDLQIVYSTSKDGSTWTVPVPVHQDKTPKIIRGFFDATILGNGEIGVAYLKDIPGKPHERDLRFVSSTGGKFGDEKVLDPFSCDCCNISLLVDQKGALHVYYRENEGNIRDIAHMTSTDHGKSFSKSTILSADNWQINGCPHSGPTSSAGGGNNLVAWFSGATDAPGIRVVDQKGNRLFVLDDPTAKNAYLVPTPTSSVLLWEQNQDAEPVPASVIAYRIIKTGEPVKTQFVSKSINGTNATGLVNNGKLVVAYEVRNTNNKNSIQVAQLGL
ncbi:sialidase family protein [Telluribacter sp. SYSU D00476]|uniref:sialidase family protein n=1 Tax=Telluribacter sp. SYSU D00476 TaxID=2811430 RepID=UPI001FF68397|nr:sialidase family protein [Telluribacter sp. SYSU D00476]